MELQARLAQLLSQWGSAVFLAVFVAITATFAFNIHWLAIYRKVTTLSWLGSGVKSQDEDTAQVDQQNNVAQSRDNAKDENTNQKTEHEQLPLELQAADHSQRVHEADSSGRFSTVLSDFLSTSGLADSVKASMATAKAAAASHDEKSETPDKQLATTNDMTGSTISDTEISAVSTPVTAPVRKVEPSFAWNDANTVNDLLASEQMAYRTNTTQSATAPIPNDTHVDTTTEASQEVMASVSGKTPTKIADIQLDECEQESLTPPQKNYRVSQTTKRLSGRPYY